MRTNAFLMFIPVIKHIFISVRQSLIGSCRQSCYITSVTIATNEPSSTLYIIIQISVSSKTFLFHINPSVSFHNKVIQDPNTVERSQGHIKIDIVFLSEEKSFKAKQHSLTSIYFHPMREIGGKGYKVV